MDNPTPTLLTEAQACLYLSVSRSFLARGRMDGPRQGHAPPPPDVRIGKMIRYEVEAPDAWIAAHRCESSAAGMRGGSGE